MTIKRFVAPAVICLLTTCLTMSSASAQFSELLQRVPDSANTIMLLNAEKLLNSEVALREGWRTNFEKAVASGVTRMPDDTQQYVLASQMDFEYMHPVWQVGTLSTTRTHDMAEIAKKKKGTQDTISGLSAVLLPTDNYLIQLTPNTYATMVPADRQTVARWIRTTTGASPRFSPYIGEAIGYAEEAGTEVIMAMDLTDVLDEATVRELAKQSTPLKSAGVNLDAAVKVLTSLRGVMLGITFGSKPFGSIKVDFAEDASVLESVAPALLADALAKRGAMIDDFTKWTGKTDGKQIRFSGDLSAEGLRQIFSLMDPPTASTLPAPTASSDQSASDQDPEATATQQYFASVNEYIRDLRNKEPQRIAQYGIWFDKYARKIDQLPMVNVDDEMLDFGAYVAQQFRNAGSAIQGIGVRSRVRQVQNVNAAGAPGYWGGAGGGGYYDGRGYAYRGYYYSGFGGYGRNYQQAELRQQQSIRTQVKVEEKAMGTSAARAIVKDIDGAVAHIRREMTKKYNVEFKG
jgi:hypothetical protein